jgi:hypothetical protein
MNWHNGYYEDEEGDMLPCLVYPSANAISTPTSLFQNNLFQETTTTKHEPNRRYGTVDQSIKSVKEDIEKLFARVEQLGNEWVGQNQGRNLSQYLYKHFGFDQYSQNGFLTVNQDGQFQREISQDLARWVGEAVKVRNRRWRDVAGFGGEYLV